MLPYLGRKSSYESYFFSSLLVKVCEIFSVVTFSYFFPSTLNRFILEPSFSDAWLIVCNSCPLGGRERYLGGSTEAILSLVGRTDSSVLTILIKTSFVLRNDSQLFLNLFILFLNSVLLSLVYGFSSRTAPCRHAFWFCYGCPLDVMGRSIFFDPLDGLLLCIKSILIASIFAWQLPSSSIFF